MAENSNPDTDAPIWTLNLSNAFLLLDPAGNEVRLPTWKTEALLTMLVTAGSIGVPKETVSTRLWPGQPSPQAAANLRQTVRRLRLAIGSDRVLAVRDTFRLAEDFLVRTDESADSVRPQTHDSPAKQTPIQALLQMVNWALDFDPSRAVDLLRSNHDIALEFSPLDLKPLTNRLMHTFKPSDPLFGWALYFLGNAQFQSAGFSEVTKTFTRAMNHAREFADDQLAALSVVFLCAAALCHGQTSVARKANTHLNTLAGRSQKAFLRGHVVGTQGALHQQEGRFSEALMLLREAVDLSAEWPQEQAHIQVQYAFCLATVGQISPAVQILDSLKDYCNPTDFQRLQAHIGLVEQMILLRDHQFHALRDMSFPLIRRASATGSGQTELHAREVLAAGAWEAGEKDLAEKEWRAAIGLRRKLGMRPTTWDRARLKDLPLAMELFAGS